MEVEAAGELEHLRAAGEHLGEVARQAGVRLKAGGELRGLLRDEVVEKVVLQVFAADEVRQKVNGEARRHLGGATIDARRPGFADVVGDFRRRQLFPQPGHRRVQAHLNLVGKHLQPHLGGQEAVGAAIGGGEGGELRIDDARRRAMRLNHGANDRGKPQRRHAQHHPARPRKPRSRRRRILHRGVLRRLRSFVHLKRRIVLTDSVDARHGVTPWRRHRPPLKAEGGRSRKSDSCTVLSRADHLTNLSWVTALGFPATCKKSLPDS